ncbi:MAG: family 10 glycosylhydrolase [Planctomycetaceae bacterium]|jgi:uncharacterized lipoprotein YddW (UPF0748 family)|nr:family 10 glycosylhydrolase [Planctomycetaceae bacterium]
MPFIRSVLFLSALLFAPLLFADVPLLTEPKTFELPFASQPDAERGYIDIRIQNPDALFNADIFAVEFECSEPEAMGDPSFYFHSGSGWYNYSVGSPEASALNPKRFQFEVIRSRWSHTEEKPGPVEKADIIRFGFWRGGSKDAEVKLLSINAEMYSILLLTPENKEGEADAKNLLNQMKQAGIPAGTLPQKDLAADLLNRVKVIILPQNTEFTPEQTAVLQQYREKGGITVDYQQLRSGDTPDSKRRSLLNLFGSIDPSFLHRDIVKRWQQLFSVGDPRNRSIEKRQVLAEKYLANLKTNGFDLPPEFFTRGADEEIVKKFVPRFEELSERLNSLRQSAIREYCASVPPKTPEFRAWWEHAGLGAYPGDWERTMKELSEAGFNAVIPNFLWGGSANYASDVLHRNKKFEQYGDQVEQAIAAGKKYGVEVHAWQVCWRLEGSPREYIEKMQKEGRTQVSFNGEPSAWLCPSNPKNIDLECETLCELVRKYKDLDGIHFDYIRYPDSEHCYCEGCKERFESAAGVNAENFPKDVRGTGKFAKQYNQWRCGNITKLVERVHKEAKVIRSNIKISAAVFPSYPGCKYGISQDWGLWVERGYLDFVCPMDYTDNPANFEGYIQRQKEIVKDRIPLYPGIGATATGIAMTPDRVAAEIDIVRKQNAPGFVIFNLTERTIQSIPPMMKLGPTR